MAAWLTLVIGICALALSGGILAADDLTCKKKDVVCQRLEALQARVEKLSEQLADVGKLAKIASVEAEALRKGRRLVTLDFTQGNTPTPGNWNAGCDGNCASKAKWLCGDAFNDSRADPVFRMDDGSNISHLLCRLDP